MKYVKEPKRYVVLDDFEWRALVKGINEYRKQVIDENGCVEVVNELLLKIIDAPTSKTNNMEGSKRKTNLSAKLALGDSATTII